MTEESWERLTRSIQQAVEKLDRLRQERDRLAAENERLRERLSGADAARDAAAGPSAGVEGPKGVDAERLEHLEWEREQVRERLGRLLRRLEEAGLAEEP